MERKQFLQNMINTEEILMTGNCVAAELYRAVGKFPKFPCDPVHAVSVMAEESGEAIQAALQLVYENGSLEKLREEVIQTTAMCIRIISGIDSGDIR